MQSELPQLQIHLLQHHHLSVIATAAQPFGHPVVNVNKFYLRHIMYIDRPPMQPIIVMPINVHFN